MNIITQPSVYVIGRQSVDESELNRFLSDHGVTWESDSEIAGEVIAETAGRVCFMSFAKPRPGGNSAYLSHIKDAGHGSVLEHAVWNLLITGVSRSLTHELIRHRAGVSPSQLSQRYVDESDCEFVVPPSLAEEIDAGFSLWASSWGQCNFGRAEYDCLMSPVPVHENEAPLTEEERIGVEWVNAIATAHRAYTLLSDYLTKKAKAIGMSGTDARKFARQAARSVLPNATETKIMVTANARALRNILEQRGSRHAEPEIRKLANMLLDVLSQDAPNIFGDYEKTALPDGTYEITTPYPKV